MTFDYKDYEKSAQYIQSRLNGFVPDILMILGSGLGFMGDTVENPIFVDYKDIPGFKASTAPGHAGRFVFGTLCGKKVAVMQGRMHTYEGYEVGDVVYPVRVMRLVGAKLMIVTNAAGAIRTDWNPGDIMLITDHLKLCLTSPLAGPNIEEFGTRFPDMTTAYSKDLQEIARQTAKDMNMTLREGVYIFFPGPQFETPAEVRAARILGADASGMSTVPEVIAAAHCGYKTLGFSLCTNMAAGILDQPLSGEEVNITAAASKAKFSAFMKEVLKRIEI